MGQQSLSSEEEDAARHFSFYFLFFFPPGFVKFLRGHETTFNLSYGDQADLLKAASAPSENFRSPSPEIVTTAAAEVSQGSAQLDRTVVMKPSVGL